MNRGVGRTDLDDWLGFVTFQEDFRAALFKRSVGSFENLDQLHAGMAIGDRPCAGVDAVEEVLAFLAERLPLLQRDRLRTADGSAVEPGAITGIDQRLDLWSGALSSRFAVDGRTIQVTTARGPRSEKAISDFGIGAWRSLAQ